MTDDCGENAEKPSEVTTLKDVKIQGNTDSPPPPKKARLSSETESEGDTPNENGYEIIQPTPSTSGIQKLLPVSRSPRKKLDITSPDKSKKDKQIFRYGNYAQYYGYRNSKNFHDVRLDIFKNYKELFEGKDVLDVGCNTGRVTIHIGKHMNVKSIIGIDIDKTLITRARNYIRRQRQFLPSAEHTKFPFHTSFVNGNYVLRHEVLLEMEKARFDLILCLSVTKWIHLNFGDAGLKLVFKRMFLQLREGGRLILEPQPWESYARRKKLTPDIFENYKSIQFRPKEFKDYLLGPEVGFNEFYQMETPNHDSKGFKRPLYVFVKK